MTEPPVVVNPEAVGDPNRTPTVRLWPTVRARSCPNCHSIGTPRVLDRPRDGKPRAYCRDPWHDTTGE